MQQQQQQQQGQRRRYILICLLTVHTNTADVEQHIAARKVQR
jgi:hypothetical protein